MNADPATRGQLALATVAASAALIAGLVPATTQLLDDGAAAPAPVTPAPVAAPTQAQPGTSLTPARPRGGGKGKGRGEKSG